MDVALWIAFGGIGENQEESHFTSILCCSKSEWFELSVACRSSKYGEVDEGKQGVSLVSKS
jgi:hypothetical protein